MPHTRPHQVVIVHNAPPSLPAQLRRQMHAIKPTRVGSADAMTFTRADMGEGGM
ncbi:hypothetical protein [Streptomyces sp. IB2014 016-6]|uniref:hypothetical protein n=1 Tax=Streptomyces sp. IB2014 016-6 TaxID=2517818 RepID=UPI00164FFF55|nr:hypothetical protein [Streptomyces sp. IB2014 016-6]